MMWFATYCGEVAPASHSPGASDALTPAVSKLDSADTEAVHAGGQQRKEEKPARGLHTHHSALTAKSFSRDPETNGMLPAIWRPYRVPSVALCSSVASNFPVPCTVPSPLHLSEVEPEYQ